ncbi:MAG: cytochrome c biogenesis protein CcsA [Phycisphaerae bacterium]
MTQEINMRAHRRISRWLPVIGLVLATLAAPAPAGREPYVASQTAVQLDPQIDWSRTQLIVVQDGNRYKTLESFARESLLAMSGREHLSGLSPLASLFEWLFNRAAYDDTPVVRIKDKGLRVHFSAHMTEEKRWRIVNQGYMTPRELVDPVVQQRMRELEPRNVMVTAMRRVRHAESVARFLDQMLRIVPDPDPSGTALWHTPGELRANLPDELLQHVGVTHEAILQEVGGLVPGISPDQAVSIILPWSLLRASWLRGDAAGVQTALDRLSQTLPTMAAAGVYPKESQRAAEARYYRMGKLTWGWGIYFLGALVSVWALVTRWRTSWRIALILLAAAMGVHAYGIGLRWYILGRIPVANMFEAVISSAWMGIAVALLFELYYRPRVLLLAAHLTGFLALVLGGYVIPGSGTLTSIMGILDDTMLRIHTVLIIASYALIFVAAVIAAVYLLGYYLRPSPRRSTQGAAALAGGTSAPELLFERPIRSGGAPGDESRSENLPAWLDHFDWSHLIILNLVFVMLFVGIILGAVWADYSWGRPWGWDPKEVFAMNTWIIYAILIHVRFIVKAKGVWTAWLSLAGCLMMAFNWCFVNFYIVGLHSYA